MDQEIKTTTGSSSISANVIADRGSQQVWQKVWRLIVVTVLVIIGADLGYQLASALVAWASVPGAEYSPNGYLRGFHELIASPAIRVANETGFVIIGGLMAFLLASAVYSKIESLGDSLKEMQASEKIAIFVGLFLGLLFTALIAQITLKIMPLVVGVPLTLFLGVVFVYLGFVGIMSVKDEFRFVLGGPAPLEDADGKKLEKIKILDTNVIIDGRVSDVCRTGFIDGPIYIPGFVLDEIQHIADSADALKRARGRRGLDILNQMRSELPLIVRSLDSRISSQGHEEVDAKLVRLAKVLDGAIVTNDFNLNKVAELQGVQVLNINELANALKPVVLPGEEMRVTVIKEGKEQNQGVAYLDDGTMIVIEGGRRRIGETLDVVVSSVLQTVAGKMIFASIRQGEDGQYEEDGPYEPNPRAYSGGRTRRPLR